MHKEERGEPDEDRDRDTRPERSEGRDEREGSGSSSLLVRNLSYRIRAEEIRRMMERYGDVRDVYIPLDFYTKKPRGFAFVEFVDSRDAK